MKKLLLLSTFSLLSVGAFAQQLAAPIESNMVNEYPALSKNISAKVSGTNKAAGLTDTFNWATDSMAAGTSTSIWYDYANPLDSGILYGTNWAEFKGFAYLYDLDFDNAGSTPDTTTQILGFYSKWGGRIQTTSTKTVTFSVWNRGTNKIATTRSPKFFVYGTPNALYSSASTATVNIKSFPTNGNGVLVYLTSPVTGIASEVYVGYTTNYQWTSLGTDTFGLRTTSTAGRETNFYTLQSGTNDTLVSANAVVQKKDGSWASPLYNLNISNGDPIIAPLIQVSCPKCGLGVGGGFRSKNLTAYGNYPNPATTTTNVKFSIANSANVTVTLVDNIGREVRRYDLGKKAAGEYSVPVSVEDLSAGNYACVLQTSDGDVLAVQVSVIK